MQHEMGLLPDGYEHLSLMQQYTVQGKLRELYALTERLMSEVEGPALGEVYLYRAQLKLFILDPTFAGDLEYAERLLAGGSRIPSFLATFQPLDPNGFILFEPRAGSVADFISTMHASAAPIEKYCGDAGISMCSQLESEILYYTGKLEEGAQIAESRFRYNLEQGLYSFALMAGYTLLRCHFALGDAEGAMAAIQEVYVLARRPEQPNLQRMYATIRSWINLTTGWSGDTPRFNVTPSGKEFPVLDDRLDAIQEGIDQLGPTEAPFVDIARQVYPEGYTMRECYMDVFGAMADYRNGDKQGLLQKFQVVYQKAYGNRIIMPLVEYGRQIVPLVEYLIESEDGKGFDRKWLADIAQLAMDYERGLETFRS